MLWLLLTACLSDAELSEPGWQTIQRDPVNPVIAPPRDSPSVVLFQDGVSGVFVDPASVSAVHQQSDTGWSWSAAMILADDVVDVSHVESPLGTVLFAERPSGLFRGDPAADGMVWTQLDLDGHAPDVLRNGAVWWMAVHRDDGLHIVRSDDGVVWNDSARPVLTPSDGFDWMAASVEEPALVLGPDGHWYLLFTGIDDVGDACMGIAVSSTRVADPRRGVWSVAPDPLLCARSGFEEDAIRDPEALVWRDFFHVWYTGLDGNGEPHVGHAGTAWPIWTPEP